MLSHLDFKTITVCHIVITAFIGLVLVFCRCHQKTYPGFDFWAAASLAVTAGYVALLARTWGWHLTSIIGGNSLFVLAALLRLEAALRFLRQQTVPRPCYLLIPAVAGSMAFFTLAVPAMAVRNLMVSTAVSAILLQMAWLFARHGSSRRPGLYRAISFMMATFAAMTLFRAVLWMLHPEVGFFEAPAFHAPYILGGILGEIGMGITFLLINSQRLEQELEASQAELRSRLAEIKVLTGMLPICASCKSIHDGKGHWEHIESYVQRHTEAEFSHSICPECVTKLYPEYAQAINGKRG